MGYSEKNDLVKRNDKIKSQENKGRRKRTVGGVLLRSLVSIVWIVVTTVVSLLACYVMATGVIVNIWGDKRGMVLCVGAIVLCLIICILSFAIPYLRKGGITKFCGIVVLADALWWIYIMFAR